MKADNGFTILELIVVVLAIVILLGVIFLEQLQK